MKSHLGSAVLVALAILALVSSCNFPAQIKPGNESPDPSKIHEFEHRLTTGPDKGKYVTCLVYDTIYPAPDCDYNHAH
jgi:hypothetical protein